MFYCAQEFDAWNKRVHDDALNSANQCVDLAQTCTSGWKHQAVSLPAPRPTAARPPPATGGEGGRGREGFGGRGRGETEGDRMKQRQHVSLLLSTVTFFGADQLEDVAAVAVGGSRRCSHAATNESS